MKDNLWRYIYSGKEGFRHGSQQEDAHPGSRIFSLTYIGRPKDFPTRPEEEEVNKHWMGSNWSSYKQAYMNQLPRGFLGRGEGNFYGCYFRLTEEMKEWLRE